MTYMPKVIEDEVGIRHHLRELLDLLVMRPISEHLVTRVKSYEELEHLEIVEGEWIGLSDTEEEIMGGEEHGWLETVLVTLITVHVMKKRLGRVYPGDTDFVLQGNANDIQYHCRPDVAFVAHKNVVPSAGFVYAIPDLVIEIISPSEKKAKIEAKLAAYKRYGVKVIWHVCPKKQQVIVFSSDGGKHTYRIGDVITAADVLPDFSLSVSELFTDEE